MNPVLKGLLHLFISAGATAAAAHISSGAPVTSGNVLIPAVVAGVFAVGHAIAPSIIPDSPPPSQPTSNFPSTK